MGWNRVKGYKTYKLDERIGSMGNNHITFITAELVREGERERGISLAPAQGGQKIVIYGALSPLFWVQVSGKKGNFFFVWDITDRPMSKEFCISFSACYLVCVCVCLCMYISI